MSIIKENIKLNNLDINLKISLGGNGNILGYQQEIDNLTNDTKDELINIIIDNEVRRFRLDSNNPINILFYFTASGISHYNSFNEDGARFVSDEINSSNLKILNSFFIMDFYDTYDSYTQTKIFTNYLTKISGKYDINENNFYKPYYQISSNIPNQLYSWNIPKSFTDNQTGSTVTGYVKFSFFNAKFGDMALFYNKDNQTLQTQEKMYFKVLLDLNAKTWKFDYSGTAFPPNVKAYQIPFTNSYSQKINESIEYFDNERQLYPNGNIFDDTTGGYINEL